MTRLSFLVAVVASLAAHAMAADEAGPAGAERFRPKWQVGDQWVVETRSRQPQVAHTSPLRITARWRFSVQASEPVAGQRCFRIDVRPVDAHAPRTVVWVDHATGAIRQIRTQLPTAGGHKAVTESYRSGTAAPVVCPLTALPIALPQFPEPGIKGLETYRYETISGPGGIKTVGDIGFSTEIRQTFSRPAPDRIKGLFDDGNIKRLQNRPLIEVQLSTPDERIRQVWAQDSPWPLLTDNGLTQARLIEITPAANGGERLPINDANELPVDNQLCEDDGIKSLETRDGLEQGEAQFIPWSGYWWPIRQGQLLVPLGKYDRLTGYKAARWERQENPPGPDVPEWWGYCHAWAAASVLESEPNVARMVHTARTRLRLDVGDQKGLVTACHTEDLSNSWGDRFGDDEGSEDRQDLRPDQLWRLLKLHLGQQGVPLVLDVEAGEEVWNYPIYRYQVEYQPSRNGFYQANLTLFMADDGVVPEYLGTKIRKQTYQFRFKMRDGSVLSGSGEWLGRSRRDHPDFAWYPFKPVATNPEVKYDAVRNLVDGAHDVPSQSEEPPTEPPAEPPTPGTPQPSTPPAANPQPKPEPAPAVTPRAKRPKVEPGRPKPQPEGARPANDSPSMPPSERPAESPNHSTRMQPAQDARVIVLSPMELVALIVNKTSSFEFDAMLDRFDGASYRPGETFFVRVKSEQAGYLYLLQVDSSGNPALIYPTAGENNRIAAGKLVDIRPNNAATGFAVAGPAGVVRVKAVVTSRPLAFSGSLNGLESDPVQAQKLPSGDPGEGTTRRQPQARPVPFRWHPTQRQQVQQLLSQDETPDDPVQLGCKSPQEVLGPFAQDMTTFYIDTGRTP